MAKSSGSIWVSLGLRTDQFSKGVKQSRGKLKGFQKETDSLTKGMRGLGSAIAGAFAVSSISSFLSSSLSAYDEQIQAQKKLENALGFTSSALQRQASELQNITRYGDEATMAMQAQLATMGLTEDQVYKLTPLVQDLAAQTGKPLSKAAKEVTSALATGSTTLEKYGVSLTSTNSLSENFEITLQGLTDSVGGAAEKMANEGLGGVEQLNNAYGDFKESIGKVISDGLKPLIPQLIETSQAMKTLADDDTLAWWQKLGGLINSSAGAAMVKFNQQLTAGVNAATTLKGTLNNTKITVTNLKAAYDSGELSLEEYKTALQKVGKAAQEKINTFKPLRTELGRTKKEVVVLTDAQKKMAKELRDFVKIEPVTSKLSGVTKAISNEVDNINKEIQDNPKARLAIPAKVELEVGSGEAMNDFERYAEMGQEIGGVMSDGITQGVVMGFSTMGEALGTALAGGDVTAIGQQFLQQIAGVIDGIGKQMVALGTAALLAKESLKTLFANPFAAIGAGIALIAVSAAMSNLLSDSATPFAEGGLVTAPTMGLVGEGRGTTRSNPEVISPLDKLQNMIGGGDSGGEVVFRIQGNELVGILNRHNKNQSYSR
jgi:hypothetical protein